MDLTRETELEKAMRWGAIPIADGVYLCGSCRANLVCEKDPVCGVCKGKLTAMPYKMPWLGIAVMVIGIATVLTLLILLASGSQR